MRLARLRSTCPDTESCPALYQTDRNTAVVQGAVVADPEARGTRPLVAGEAAVEVPTTLVTGLPISGSALYHTKRGTILALGSLVVDPETLAALHLPAEEAAVEIHLGLPANLTRDEESG